MVFQRDPLSVSFDEAAAALISRAIANPGKNVVGMIESPPRDPVEPTPPGLTRTERAFQRALYHDERIHKARKNTGGPWSMPRPEWMPRTGSTRIVRIKVFSDTSAALKVRGGYDKGNSYVKNPELRSTAAWDRQQAGAS